MGFAARTEGEKDLTAGALLSKEGRHWTWHRALMRMINTFSRIWFGGSTPAPPSETHGELNSQANNPRNLQMRLKRAVRYSIAGSYAGIVTAFPPAKRTVAGRPAKLSSASLPFSSTLQ